MTNIKHYSDQELSLLFFNEEQLYKTLMTAVRRNDFSIVKELCDEAFIYTCAQLEDLRDTFNNEVKDYEN